MTDKVYTPEDEQIARRIKEVERLASLAPGEYLLWLPKSAERLGMSVADLKAAVEAKLKERKEIADKEERRTRDEDRKLARVEADAQSKAKAKRRLFQQLRGQSEQKQQADIKLWCDTYKEDPEVIAEELAAYLAPTIDPPVETAEMWRGDPVDGAALIEQIERRITRHVLMVSNAGTIGAAFWTLQTWLHSSIALFSPILAPWSAEAEQGKTTLLEVISWMVPRPHKEVTPTISLYQTIDAEEPTLFIEEGEKLFKDRKLHEIINASWTRGSLVYRMIRGVRTPFRIFCPKAIALLGRNDVPASSATRCIFIGMMAPTADEKVEPFKQEDDEKLREIRLKAARWAADHMAALRNATPSMPPGFINRLANNWSLMFAMADLIGGDWPQRLRLAATQLAPIDEQNVTWSKRLLAEFRAAFEVAQRRYVTSKEIHQRLVEDELGPWGNYHGHQITQREIAHILRSAYQIHHQKVGPEDNRVWGYRADDFAERFKRILQNPLVDPDIRTGGTEAPKIGVISSTRVEDCPDVRISPGSSAKTSKASEPETPSDEPITMSRNPLKTGHRLGFRADYKVAVFDPDGVRVSDWFDSRKDAKTYAKSLGPAGPRSESLPTGEPQEPDEPEKPGPMVHHQNGNAALTDCESPFEGLFDLERMEAAQKEFEAAEKRAKAEQRARQKEEDKKPKFKAAPRSQAMKAKVISFQKLLARAARPGNPNEGSIAEKAARRIMTEYGIDPTDELLDTAWKGSGHFADNLLLAKFRQEHRAQYRQWLSQKYMQRREHDTLLLSLTPEQRADVSKRWGKVDKFGSLILPSVIERIDDMKEILGVAQKN
jgi:hypothetical protein